MLRPILLVSLVALTAPAWSQEPTETAPPVTEGVAAPGAEDRAAPDMAPGEVPAGVDHSKMDHSKAAKDAATDAATTATESTEEGAAATMTTAKEGQAAVGANADASAEEDVAATTDAATEATTTTTTTTTTTADATMPAPAAPTATFTGMGGPADIQAEWSQFDKGGDGMLTPLEFAVWMADNQGRPATEQSLKGDAVALLNDSADELGMVDTNNDWHISRDELTAASPQ